MCIHAVRMYVHAHGGCMCMHTKDACAYMQ